MKKLLNTGGLTVAFCLASTPLWADDIVKVNAPNVSYAELQAMLGSSFKTKGIAKKDWLKQTDFNKICSSDKQPSKAEQKRIEAEQMKTIKYPADGKYFGDWKIGEKIAQDGRAMTWKDKSLSQPRGRKHNGGSCYNCHQLGHNELSFGTIGPSLLNYAQRGDSETILKYTWGKIYNAKAYNACSHMPRNGTAGILTEELMKHVMAFLYDPESPVNKK